MFWIFLFGGFVKARQAEWLTLPVGKYYLSTINCVWETFQVWAIVSPKTKSQPFCLCFEDCRFKAEYSWHNSWLMLSLERPP